MVTTLGNLPQEILQKVSFYVGSNKNSIRECMLVCSAWKTLYQKLLYSSICLYCFSQTLKLVNTLENNSHYSGLVEEIYVNYDIRYYNDIQNETIATLFNCISNLETATFCYSSGMRCLLDAVLANKLPKLNCIEPLLYDANGISYYTACVLLLKDRLQYLSITDFLEDEDENTVILEERTLLRRYNISGLFHCIFNVLDEFVNLVDLEITMRANNDIYWLEKVINCCPHLESLMMTFNEEHENTSSSIEITNVTPASKVLDLTFVKVLRFDYLFTSYIASKFTSLQKFSILEPAVQNLPLSKLEFNVFLKYLSKLDYVHINCIPFEQDSFFEVIGPFWKAKAKTRLMSFEFLFNNEDVDMEHLSMKINHSHISNVIQYTRLTKDIDYSAIIKTYGQKINSLTIRKPRDFLQWTNLYDSLLLQPLKHCSKLQRLELDGISLSESQVPNISVRRETFGSLCFTNCIIEKGTVFENISRLFAHIQQLELKYFNYDTRRPSYVKIHLEETDIGCLLFSIGIFVTESCKILVKLTNGQSHDYYTLATRRNLDLKKINLQQFNYMCEHNESVLFDLKFRSVKSIAIKTYASALKIQL